MAYRRTRILVDSEIEAGVEAAGSVAAYAAQMGCSTALVTTRRAAWRRSRGDVMERRDISWDDRLAYVPTRRQVFALLAYGGADACRERWGAPPSDLLKSARP